MKKPAIAAVCIALLSAWPLWALSDDDPNDDVYGEGAIQHYKDSLPDKPAWKEQGLVIPPYPKQKNLIRVDVGRYDYPYKVFVDSASLSVGKKDRVVRYTVVLRSGSGVDNVSFEGIRCIEGDYKRYAYGSGGKFHDIPGASWKPMRHDRQDIYRNVLAHDYFCPVPTGKPVPQLISKLKGTGDGFIFQGDLE